MTGLIEALIQQWQAKAEMCRLRGVESKRQDDGAGATADFIRRECYLICARDLSKMLEGEPRPNAFKLTEKM